MSNVLEWGAVGPNDAGLEHLRESTRRILSQIPSGTYTHEEFHRLLGIHGDGVHDDTEGIQALADIGGLAHGFPHGQYRISSPIEIS